MDRPTPRHVRVLRFAAALTAAAGLALLAVPSGASADQSSCAAGDSWRQFHYGAAKAGWNCAEDTISASNAHLLAQRWAAGGNAFTGSPIVNGSRVYVTSENDVGTTETTSLLALRRDDGSTVWSSVLADSPIVPPGALASVDGKVLVSVGGALQAYRTDTGVLSWSTSVGGQSRGPTVSGSIAYLGTSDQKVLAVDTRTGQVRWTTTVSGEVSSELGVSGGRVFVAAGDQLYALRATTGQIQWHSTIGEVFGGGTAVSGDTVYVAANVPTEGSGSVLYAFATRTGALRWSAQAGDDVHSVPTVDDHNVYIGSIGSQVRAFAKDTGASRWVQDFGGQEVWSSLASANGVVYLTTDTDRAYGLDASTGTVVFTAAPS
ncbi:MAG: outer membrane protein assembly factor BamB family protein, partial [Nocardioides sp.]